MKISSSIIFVLLICASIQAEASVACVSRLSSKEEISLADWIITGTITEVDSTNGTIFLGSGDAVVLKGVVSIEGSGLPRSIPVASHCWRFSDEESSWVAKKVKIYGINNSEIPFVHEGYISIRPIK